MSNQETIFSEKDGDTFYSITKGVFYIKDFMTDSYSPPEDIEDTDLDDLLNGLGISLN